MALSDIYAEIRATVQAERGQWGERKAWEQSLVDRFADRLEEAGLTMAGARQWLAHAIHNIVADTIKPSGASPRAAAGQMLAWPEMRPVDGWHALRTYARQQRGVYLRYQLVVRILACLDIAFGEQAELLNQYSTLADACLAAGVDARDIEALAA